MLLREGWPGLGQYLVQGTKQEIMHMSRIAEAHFMLGRMRIHIDRSRIHVEKQQECRVPSMKHDILECLSHCMRNHLVAHNAPVDMEILQVGLCAGKCRQRHPAMQPKPG